MKFLLENFMVYIIGYKAVPPAKMIPDKQNRFVLSCNFAFPKDRMKMPFDHVLAVQFEKPDEEGFVIGFDHITFCFYRVATRVSRANHDVHNDIQKSSTTALPKDDFFLRCGCYMVSYILYGVRGEADKRQKRTSAVCPEMPGLSRKRLVLLQKTR